MNSNASCLRHFRRASALVVTLAFIIILTVILLAYFNIVTVDRMATRNYAQSLKAEAAARGAMDFVVGQMRAEMARGASPLRVGSYSLFTNVMAANVRPEPMGTNGAMPALIKMAGTNQGAFSNAPQVAANALSSATSVNGRRVPPGRWSRPGLGTVAGGPAWFLVGPGGITNAPATNVECRFAFVVYDLGSLVDINAAGLPSSLTSPQRQALQGTAAALDLVALGLDQSASDDLIGNFRNRASSLDYTNYVLRVAATNGFLRVQPGDDTFLSRQDFLAYAKTKGLTNAAANFTTFSRAVIGPSWAPGMDAASFAIQTVTRTNIVNWNPSAGASVNVLPAGVSYRSDSATSASINRSFLTQVVTGTFRREDGTPARAGEPLVTTRFPLNRLAWLSKDGPSAEARSKFGSDAEAAARIKAAFGLVWDSVNRLWVYTSPAASNGGGSFVSGNSNGPANSGRVAGTIKTLAVVASENREPDFFELLQAGILKGSLGQRSSIANPNGIPQPGEVTPQGHLFQIGANIIDQSDADDFPTLIRACMPAVMEASPGAWDSSATGAYVLGGGLAGLTPHDFAGVENLPYLMALRPRAFRPQAGNSADGARRLGQGILLPQFWNPHQNAGSPSADRPSRFRILQTFGEIRMAFMGNKRGGTVNTFFDPISGGIFGYAGYVTSPPSAWPSPSARPQPMIEFTGAAAFGQPGFLAPNQVTATSAPENLQTALTADLRTKADVDPTGFVGFWLGGAPAPGTAYVATTPIDESSDNTPVDRQVWSYFTGQPVAACPVQQDIHSIATPVARNSTPLPASDRFWKGDGNLAINNQRWPVFELQYLDAGVWKTYQRFDGVLRGGGSDHKWDTLVTTFVPANQFAGSFVSESHAALYGRIDPRGSRLGLVRIHDPGSLYYDGTWNGSPLSYRNVPMSGALGTTGRPNGEASVVFDGSPVQGNQGGAEFTDTFNDATRWLTYGINEWQNNRNPGQRYTDNDRILRRADGNAAAGVNALAAGTDARPMMLNRPFRTPGDLGYVHRDLPFKTLDFFSETSADAGLLDLFSVLETPAVVAGRINLNGRNSAVLKQVLHGAVIREMTQAALSDPQAGSIATNLTGFSATNAFTGLWDLPGFLGSPAYQGAVTGDVARMKTQAEAVSRQLAAVTDARCWNLLVDVVAQSGKYSAKTTDPNQFIVEGERRYWLQIAIDRYTGKVVSQQLEPVYE